MKNNSGDRSRWKAEWLKEGRDEMIESLTTIFKGGGSREKIQKNQRGIFITNIVPKAYEIVKKIQNEAVQNNMQTAGKKKEQQWIASL